MFMSSLLLLLVNLRADATPGKRHQTCQLKCALRHARSIASVSRYDLRISGRQGTRATGRQRRGTDAPSRGTLDEDASGRARPTWRAVARASRFRIPDAVLAVRDPAA